MKILIFIGMVIIFISAFFIIYIFESVVVRDIECMAGLELGACDIRETTTSFVVAMGLIAMFLIVDSAVVYLIMKSISTSGSSYIAYSV